MALDTELSARLDGIARVIETYMGLTPGALARDVDTPARLYRIERALDALVQFLTIGYSPAGTTLSWSVQDPENVKTFAARGTKSVPAWLNKTGRTLTITRVTAIADADNYSFNLFKSASLIDLSTANDVLLTNVVCADNGTASFYQEVTSLAVATVEPNKWLIWEHNSGSAESVTIFIEGILA